MPSERARVLAGAAFVGVGTITILGMVTAEALYPGYSAATQTISALGSTGAPPQSRTIFNAAMVVAGALTVFAAFGVHHVYDRPSLTGVIAVTGVGGFVGVGLFPVDTGAIHAIAAVVVFVGAGVAAILAAWTVRGAFGNVSAALGILELIAFLLFVTLGGSTPVGIGGLERWVAYLALVWVVAFGGYLLAVNPSPPRQRHGR